MAGFADIVRNGVALANSLTGTLQVPVSYEPWIDQDAFGNALYGPVQTVMAIVERESRLVVDASGQEIKAEHTINLLRPVAPNGAESRDEPIDGRDRFTLPDGSTGRIATVETLVDPAINSGYYHIVHVGKKI